MMTLIKKGDPRKVKTITLGKDPYIDTLYGTFRVDNPTADRFSTTRQVEILFKSGILHQVTVPEHLRLPLPGHQKVVNTPLYHLEPIGDHRDTMMLLTMRAGWNQTETDINRMLDLDPCGTFVAKLKGDGFDIPLATSSVLPLGPHNTWIGMILVHPELRRQGIANQMMQFCVHYAIDQGKRINGLDATPMGNTVYGAVGYVDAYRIWRSVFELEQFHHATYNPELVKPITAKELDEVIRYDASSFMEREQIMRRLFHDNRKGCFVARNHHGDITGYCYTRPGRIRAYVGPCIANDDDTATALLTAASQFLLDKGNTDAFIDTPESQFAHKGRYRKGAFDHKIKPSKHKIIKSIRPVRDYTRMYQAVDYQKADILVTAFMNKEKLSKHNPRVEKFAHTMYKAVAHCTETLAFKEYEAKRLQVKFWGITGPEKG